MSAAAGPPGAGVAAAAAGLPGAAALPAAPHLVHPAAAAAAVVQPEPFAATAASSQLQTAGLESSWGRLPQSQPHCCFCWLAGRQAQQTVETLTTQVLQDASVTATEKHQQQWVEAVRGVSQVQAYGLLSRQCKRKHTSCNGE